MKLKDLCFEIIKACPNQCKFCSSCSSPNETEIISYDIFKQTIDNFIELGGIEELSISGGEPLLHPNILEIIGYVKDKGIKTVLYTSGICKNINKIPDNELNQLENKYIKKIIGQMNNNYSSIPRETVMALKAIGLDKIIFDLQSINENNYNYLMETRNYLPYVLQSIARTTAIGIPTEIHFIPLKTNQNDLLDILEIAELGIDKISLLRFIPQGRGRENANNLILNNEELAQFIAKLENYNYKVEIRQGIHLLEEDIHKCTAGLDKFLIRYDGKLLPCAAFKDCDDEMLKLSGFENININDGKFNICFSNSTREKPLCKKLKRTIL